jgi:hypothetical protein
MRRRAANCAAGAAGLGFLAFVEVVATVIGVGVTERAGDLDIVDAAIAAIGATHAASGCASARRAGHISIIAGIFHRLARQ